MNKITTKISEEDFNKRVFNIADEPMPRGSWWWWFWLFFFNNPKDPSKPRQLMILWSTKNVKKIKCNDLDIVLPPQGNREKLDGAVAAWYFDGEKMHHDFLLETCKIKISEPELSTNSGTKTSFSINEKTSTVKIKDNLIFVSKFLEEKHALPSFSSNTYFGDFGYNIIRGNRFSLKGEINGEPISGTSYFQRVFVTAPSPSWYWGIFHFEKGGILSYFRPYVLGKAVKKHIYLFDGKNTHEFQNIKVKRVGGEVPEFIVSGENREEKISFTVSSYSHSSWTFKKKSLGIFPNKLVYNEYPAVISDLKLTTKKGNITLKDLGKAVGNAEHTTGFLL